jgi:excisionase family DNA binding protein
MSDVSKLLQQLGALAEQRSNLLAAEARLWAEVSQVISRAASADFAQPRKVDAPIDRRADRFLSTKQAAEYLNLARPTLERWRVYGGGPKFTKLGRRILYDKSALDSFVAAKTYPHTSAYK